MLQIILLCAILTQCGLSRTQPSSIQNWISEGLTDDQEPLTYVIRLENVHTTFPTFKSKRSIFEGIETKRRSLISELIQEFDSNTLLRRVKRTLENGTSNGRFPRNNNLVMGATGGPKDLHLKANLRYHHQQRHPNGSIIGSYAQMDPTGNLKVTHYVNDDLGFREYPEEGDGAHRTHDPYVNSPSGHVNILTNGNSGLLSSDARQSPTADGANMNFVPSIAPPYNTPAVDGLQSSPIMHSAQGSIQQFSPRSPLFEKYYRPSPEEVQRTYDYHRMRTVFDPNQFRPTDMTAIPEIPRDRQPELRSVYSEYQIPYQARSQDEPANGYLTFNGPPIHDDKQLAPNYAPPILPLNFAASPAPPQDAYARIAQVSPYPQSLEPQAPAYVQQYENPGFIPASTYNGPYAPNTATFNQPYPVNIPIYGGLLPQNSPTYNHPPPESIPVYQQQPLQQVYYASASNPQPTATAKT